jgi:hypothetical protein
VSQAQFNVGRVLGPLLAVILLPTIPVHLVLRGRALWRLQRRGAIVHTVLTDAERQVCDTDRSMSA